MPAYSRTAMMESVKASMANETAATAASEKKSAEDTTTAGAKASEEKDPATAGAKGGDDGADGDEGGDASGSQDTDSDGTTAEGDEGTSPEEQALEEGEEGDDKTEEEDSEEEKKPEATAGKWDEEEQKATKDLGLEGLEPTAETRKLLKIARDNQKAVQEAKQQIAVHNDYLATLGNSLVNHDIENLNAIVQELGGEKIPFDVRTEEDQLKEATEGFNAAFDALKAANFPKEVWDQVQQALAPLYEKTTAKVAAIEAKMSKKALKDDVLKEMGHSPVKGTYTKGLKEKADKNFIDLVKTDPKADVHMKALDPYFKSGFILQNPAKAYANAPKEINELGAAVYFAKNFQKEFYPEIKKKIIAELKLQRLGKAIPSGNKGDSQGGGEPRKTPSGNQKQNHFVASRLTSRFGKR